MKLFVLLVGILLAVLSAAVQADNLRDSISSKILVKSSLYATLETGDPNVVDLFNNNSTNITTPDDIWKQLPDWLRYTIGIVIAIVGLVITFYGVRLLPLSVFLLGGFIAAAFMYAILAAAVSNDDPNKTAIVYGSSFGTWLVVGILLACCIRLAVFVLGASLGVVTALVLNPIALKYVWPAQPFANMIIWMVIFGLIGGAIACCLERPLMVVATSAGGAFAVVASIMAMAGTLDIAASTQDGTALPTAWQDWAGFAGFLALAVFGMLIQFCCTAPQPSNDSLAFTKLE